MEKNRLTNVLLAVVIILLSIIAWNTTHQQNTKEFTFTADAPAPKEAPQSISPIAPTTHIVALGDTLSCVSPKNWREIAKLNNIENPDLIFPGQELKLPPGTKGRGGCAKVHQSVSGYCKIGADPVNPGRELTEGESEYRLSKNVNVLMGSGSGKIVKCTLRAGEVVVTNESPTEIGDIERIAVWVRKCGNPILNKVVLGTIKQTKVQLTKQEKHETWKSKGGLVILKTFEGVRSSKFNGGVLQNSEGSTVIDSSGNSVNTSR